MNQFPYRASVTLNPIIDFFKWHFIQQGSVAFWKRVPSVLLPLLESRLWHCDTTMLDVYCLALTQCCCFSLHADIRIHPSPTAGSITAASSVSTIQGKPSLRRIKGRIHRSKSLDSIDLLDSNVSNCKLNELMSCYTITDTIITEGTLYWRILSVFDLCVTTGTDLLTGHLKQVVEKHNYNAPIDREGGVTEWFQFKNYLNHMLWPS